jgi:hypothetical protein
MNIDKLTIIWKKTGSFINGYILDDFRIYSLYSRSNGDYDDYWEVTFYTFKGHDHTIDYCFDTIEDAKKYCEEDLINRI